MYYHFESVVDIGLIHSRKLAVAETISVGIVPQHRIEDRLSN